MEIKELKYYRKGHGEFERKEITYDKALSILLGTFRDNDMTRDMLTTANNIACHFSTVYVEEIWENDMVILYAHRKYVIQPRH